ncbi:SdpI family protein [Mitsuaria sp. 7]|uniref:SdpI family protein n=1 Tax=Mitsuaria sp. 7 TaxID=1658665 RepID=UPI0007DD83E9|nr:SdpI family protein [Mitsuaria sp. 7]ANH67390.1 hypothetical protein ABE85_07070 [Mitsuaria sp. 7]
MSTNGLAWMTAILFWVGDVVLAVAAIPMWQGLVPPNRTTGFRVAATLADPELWYAINAVVGRNLLALAIAHALIVAALQATVMKRHLAVSALISAGVLGIGVIAISWHGHWLSSPG